MADKVSNACPPKFLINSSPGKDSTAGGLHTDDSGPDRANALPDLLDRRGAAVRRFPRISRGRPKNEWAAPSKCWRRVCPIHTVRRNTGLVPDHQLPQ